jgi:uncharacterized repeat protein (TIGR03803 family)
VTSKREHQGLILESGSRWASSVLALALALLLTVVGTRSAQAQTYSILYSFTGAADGAYPYGGVIVDAAGNLYGITYQGGDLKGCGLFHGCGVVYKVDPSGKQTVLHTFKGNDGRQPYFGNLFRDSTGNLFGTTVCMAALSTISAWEWHMSWPPQAGRLYSIASSAVQEMVSSQ